MFMGINWRLCDTFFVDMDTQIKVTASQLNGPNGHENAKCAQIKGLRNLPCN